MLQAGINLGEARGFQPLPYSGRDEVQNLDTQGGSNMTGRYMYRVSGEKPFRGGCTNDTTLSKYREGAAARGERGRAEVSEITDFNELCNSNIRRVRNY